MPSKSEKQAKFMAACAHGAGYESCPPDDVSKEFNQADKQTGILKKRKSFKEYVNESTVHTIDFKNEHGQVIKKRIKVPNTWTKDDIKKHYGSHLVKIYD